MKSIAIFAAFASVALAVPTELAARADAACPGIPGIAPDGKLPPGTLNPTFILPVSRKKPDVAFQAGQTAVVTPGDFCSLTRFDIPASAKNKTCSLSLFLPKGPCGYGTGPHEFEEGPGTISFAGNLGIRFPVPGETTFNNQPPLADPFTDAPLIQLGNAYRLGGGPCDFTEGQPFTSVGGSICSDDTSLSFTESDGSDGGCPVGFHIIIT